MKIKLRQLVIIIAVIGLISPNFVFAAQLSFQPEQLSVIRDKPYTITLLINAEDESINAISGTVLINEKLGAVESVNDSGSIITYWVEKPKIDTKFNTVSFSGAVPGGYSGSTGILFSLSFPSYQGEQLDTAVTLIDVKALRNDGLGSNAQVTVKPFKLANNNDLIDQGVTDQLFLDDSKPDNIPPEIFSPQLSRDDRVFDGKWFINFATVDKQSGIDHYEVQETKSGRLDARNWVRADSPYVLQDQELHSFIYVIAIDRQGNERVIKVFPRNQLSWWQNNGFGILFVIGASLLILIGYKLINNKRKSGLK